jgi:hypothetical protein
MSENCKTCVLVLSSAAPTLGPLTHPSHVVCCAAELSAGANSGAHRDVDTGEVGPTHLQRCVTRGLEPMP